MLSELTGRRALVTGASGGLGLVIARALHAEGAHVILSARRANALEAAVRELGDRAASEPADLADRTDLERLAGVAKGVDVLVANAGVPASGRLEEYAPEQIDRALDVNLRAPIHLAHAAAPRMLERGAGALVFIGSLSGKYASAGQSLYSGTKFGLRGFAFGLHDELHGTGVSVTTVFPGFVSGTGMFADTGLRPPPGTALSEPDAVARAVLRGIATGRAEIVVAPLRLRFGAWAHGLAPSAGAAISRRLGAAEVAAQFAERQRGKR